MNENEFVGENGEIKPEVKAAAEELIAKLATVCKDYEPAVVMFVLEAALTEEISRFAPPLGDMFTQMMMEFKGRAVMLVGMAEMLHGQIGEEGESVNESVNDLIQKLKMATQEPKSEDPSGSI